MVSLMVNVSLSVELKLVFERFSVRLQSTFYTDRLLKLDAMRALKSETATVLVNDAVYAPSESDMKIVFTINEASRQKLTVRLLQAINNILR